MLADNGRSGFSSYVSGRTFQVIYGSIVSLTVYIPCSIPQGLLLGLHLFILYTADVEDSVASKSTTDKFQQVMNAATRTVSNMRTHHSAA